MTRVAPWRHPWVRHLRLPFQALLSPIYFYGVLEASLAWAEPGTRPILEPTVWWGWLSLHVFLYGGTTAFNSYYDRDEGPVGGMRNPPPVDRGLLPFSLAVQGVGLVPALAVGPRFTLAWIALFLVFTAYSHPAVRLKARPAAAILAIALGQGVLGFALGWLTVAPAAGLVSRAGGLGALATALVVTGLYLVTQSYQTGEDARRGDRTLPVLWGARRALHVATGVLGTGGALLVTAFFRHGGPGVAVGLALFFGVVGAWLVRFAATIDERAVTRNFRTAMALATVASTGLGVFLVAWLARPI